MELALRDVFNAYVVLAKLAPQPMRVAFAYKIGRIIRVLEPEYREIEAKRHSLVFKYGEEEEDPETGEKKHTIKTEEAVAQFNDEFSELLNTKVDLDIVPLVMEEASDDMRISPGEMSVISFLFVD